MVKSTIFIENSISGALTLAHVSPFLCSDGTSLSTEEIQNKKSGKVYPIPNDGSFTVVGEQEDEIVIFDLSGRRLYQTLIKKFSLYILQAIISQQHTPIVFESIIIMWPPSFLNLNGA